jgi:hypothetical protein
LRADYGVLARLTAGGGGAASLVPTGSGPLRLLSVPSRVLGNALLAIDANGDVQSGPLAANDIPAPFTRDDQAEVITQPWSFTSYNVYSGSGIGPPTTATRSPGTRVVLSPQVPANTDYALGVESGGFWNGVPAGGAHTFYHGETLRMRLTSTGTLQIFNGSGTVQLTDSTVGTGHVRGGTSLFLHADNGSLVCESYNRLLRPNANYREHLGAVDYKWLTVHAAELWAETLVAQSVMATIGGRVLVGKTTTLTRDCAPTDSAIYVKHKAFQLHVGGVDYGSKVILETVGKFEAMFIDSTTEPTAEPEGDYRYAVLRDRDGSGANQWFAGDAVFDTGKSANNGAFIDLYSQSGLHAGTQTGPTIVGHVRINSNYNGWEPRWAIGNLVNLYGNASPVFGAAFGQPSSTHLQIDATNGIRMMDGATGQALGQWDMVGAIRLGNALEDHITIAPATGIRLRQGSVDKIVLAPDGSAYLAAALVSGATSGTRGTVRSGGATAYNAGSGFYFDAPNPGTVTALIGNAALNRIQWDGSNITLVSNALAIDASLGLTFTAAAATEAARRINWTIPAGYAYVSGFGSSTLSNLFLGIGSHGASTEGRRIRIYASHSTPTKEIDIDMSMLSGSPAAITVRCVPNATIYLNARDIVLGENPAAETTRVLAYSDIGTDLGDAGYRFRWFKGYGILVGATLPTSFFHITCSTDSCAKPGASTWSAYPSNAAAKDEITPVDAHAALAVVRRTPMVRYRYNGRFGSPAGARYIGLTAEDAERQLPDSVQTMPDGSKAWNAHELLMLTVSAIAALAERLDAIDGGRR